MTKKIMLFIAALLLCGTMQAQNYHWSYNYHDYESNFPLIGEVYINGEVVASSDFEIAAFVGDQVRATEFLFEADPVNFPGHYYAWLGVSYNNAGETVTFKLYDHSTGTEYDNCSTTVVTNANGYGEMEDPVNINFTVATPISYGPDYPWVPGNYENYMYLETQIQINGIPVTNTNWEVGAFCGDECRGLGDADNWWVSPVDQSNILEIVVGGATGDVINFYLYDVTNQEVYPAICAVTLDWVDDDIGDMFDPFVLNFVTMQTFTMANDATDNAAIIEANHGKPANVTLTRTLQAGGWNTFCVPFSMTLAEFKTAIGDDQVQVKELTGSSLSGETLTLNFDNAASIVAGTPYLVWVTDAVANPTFNGVTVSNDVAPTETDYADFIPTLGKTTITGDAKTILFLASGNLLKNPAAMPAYMKGFRAYFQLHDLPTAARSFSLNLGDKETGIMAIDHSPLNTDQSVYDLQGRRMANGQSSTVDGQSLKKGVYIVNGKKTIIK